ncbi:cation diffusion facilitator family transporter [bacterium]|nr:cation diffusion facilitator family transporter [bacterium]
MGHGHDHGHHDHGSSGAIGFAFFLNLFFAVAEIFGGLWTNSLAILSDALHDLGDSLILGLSWFLERYSGKGRTLRYSYGYRRFSLLGALLNAVVLIAGSVFIIVEALPRLANPENPNAQGMMWFAIGGVLLNGIAMLRLRSKGKSMNARVVAWHLLEDVLGWIAVLIVSIVMQYWDVPILDPILSLMIASYILYYNVFVNFNKTIKLFLQAVPDEIDTTTMEKAILSVPHVQSVHHMHVWSLDGERHVLSAHVVVDAGISLDESLQIKMEVKRIILRNDIEHLTIEIEFEDEQCVMGDEWHSAPGTASRERDTTDNSLE